MQLVWKYGMFLLQTQNTGRLDALQRRILFGSVLLVSHDPVFCEYFGALRMALESQCSIYGNQTVTLSPNFCWLNCRNFSTIPPTRTPYCPRCGKESGNFTPKVPKATGSPCPMCTGKLEEKNSRHTYLRTVGCNRCQYKETFRMGGTSPEFIVLPPALSKSVFCESLEDPCHYGYFVKQCCALLRDMWGTHHPKGFRFKVKQAWMRKLQNEKSFVVEFYSVICRSPEKVKPPIALKCRRIS